MSMAAVVSHAMRRLPPSPQDTVYSSYGLRGEGSTRNWPNSNEEAGESALSRSMRYADPWLYGSVRAAPTGLLLAPAFVLCTCSDYVNGTKRSSKKAPSTCKKCKGTRLPLSAVDKFGTVRCYPAAAPVTPLRAGTVRVSSSSSRPSILPTADPYDLMRRSRLSVSEGSSHFRTRSTSPNKSRSSEARSHSGSRKKGVAEAYNSTFGRKSILECDINPYELMSSEADTKDSSITFVNGQRIRVKPHNNCEYEDVQVNKKPTKPSPTHVNKLKNCNGNIGLSSATKINENESDYSNNRFKSILKKRTTFNDTDSNGPERTPSPALKSGSHFYIPMPLCSNSVPRKKVQFLVENELVYQQNDNSSSDTNEENSDEHEIQLYEVDEEKRKTCKLRRSVSERFTQEQRKVVFNDTMALRTRISRGDAREAFTHKDLERLDGIRARKISPNKPRPNEPPPPPPDSTAKNNNCVTIEKSNNVAPSATIPDSAEIITADEPIANSQEIAINLNNKREPSSINMIEKGEELRIDNGSPPSAPPRKRSNNKQPQINIVNNNSATSKTHSVRIESPSHIDHQPSKNNNKTVVQINGSPAVHKLKIKNEFTDVVNVQTVSVLENPQRKTSILINGDDCYSTVNVNNDIPLYQSSVVVKDSAVEVTTPTTAPSKNSSSVYITGTFTIPEQDFNASQETHVKLVQNLSRDKFKVTKDEQETRNDCNSVEQLIDSTPPSSDRLKELLRDPVEAVRRNLVPHVCGKSDVSRRHAQDFKASPNSTVSTEHQINTILDTSFLDNNINGKSLIEESFLRLRNYESVSDDVCSEHSSSTQYELMDPGSDCYTDHSNRSSVTEEELANRTKFYELLADSAIEVFDSDEHHYESIRLNTDPIYEEIEVPPPLPANPPPISLLDDLQLDKEYTTRSIFEGASKYDILSYLVDAKERGIVQEDSYTFNNVTDDETKESFNRASHMSSVSDSSEENSLIISGAIIDEKATCQKPAEVERNDSGVGSETSKSSLSKYRTKQETSISCEDCESVIESKADNEPLICRKCVKKRSERKEIITEIVETEEKYSRDLQIILEEFYQPMLVAGLLTPDQLSAIFLNAEELLENSQALAERLRDAVEITLEQGDDDLLTVNIGKLFLEAAPMLHAFETYCVRQGAASLLLASLEKEKELLRIFLKVSQMENTMLRRMNLNSFLMVPVQRVTKYPLLLARLYKVTPLHHETREQLKEAQHKIELHLNHMNSETKDVPSKLWRRIGSNSGRRSSTEMDLVNIKLRKIAVDVLEWNHDEAKFALEGKLLFTQPTDNNWRKGRTIKLTPVNALLVINGKQTNKSDKTDENGLVFSRHSGVREAALLLVRDKNGRYSLLRDPLYLDRCVIAADPAWQSYFEVQELLGKDTFIFKAEDDEQTHTWYKQLQYHAQGMGAWRKRRNALANIMINGMGLRT